MATVQRILQLLQAKTDAADQIDWGAALDLIHIKAHRSATGGRKSAAKAEIQPRRIQGP